MSETYTPGQWQYDATTGRVDAVQFREVLRYQKDGETVEYMGGLVALPYDCGPGSARANGRLMAAAPVLLTTLKLARECIKGDRDCLAECHMNGDGTINAEGADGVADYDATLAVIDAAIACAEEAK